MVITEIFNSIEGQGAGAGLPCIFVRLTVFAAPGVIRYTRSTVVCETRSPIGPELRNN
jgi:hypothetical protein